MISIRVKKGYDLNIEGTPSVELREVKKADHVAVLPEKILFIKPALRVGEGDAVKVGSVLFEDKRNPAIKFLSPGGGKVVQIIFGPRRIIKEIVIQLDEREPYVEFEALPEKSIKTIQRDRLVTMLLNGGVWQFIRELPFRDIARPDYIPPAIIVSLDAKEPFQPRPEVYLKNKKELFEYGISVLSKLAQKVHISASHDSAYVLKEFFLKRYDELVTHSFKGNYPADDPGVMLYYTKKSPAENRSWYIYGQDVLLLAELLKFGKYPTERIMVVAGSLAEEKKHLRTRLGIPLELMVQGKAPQGVRYVVGGLLRGYSASKQSYMGFYETSLTLIPDGREREFLGFIRPGYDKPSYSRSFLSVFNKSPIKMTANLHGDERACVGCNYCVNVCPVDILPQLTLKSILADEIEEALAYGLLDCVECGLCTYVCPSKIEISSSLKNAKATYYNEQSQ